MYIRRTITHALQQASKQFPVLLITGPRQVGKTTCLRHGLRVDTGTSLFCRYLY